MRGRISPNWWADRLREHFRAAGPTPVQQPQSERGAYRRAVARTIVYQLAGELGVRSWAVTAKLSQMGIEASPSGQIDVPTADRVRQVSGAAGAVFCPATRAGADRWQQPPCGGLRSRLMSWPVSSE